MKTFVLAILILVQGGYMYAQDDTEILLIGTWAVSEAKAELGPDLIPAEGANMEGQLKVVEDLLSSSKFIFLEKNEFNYFSIDRDSKIDGGVWTLSDKHIKITKVIEDDRIETLMEIEILSIDEAEAKIKVNHISLIYTLNLTKQAE